MKNLFVIVALAAVSSAFANPYYQQPSGQGYCPNCPGGHQYYQGQQGYQNQQSYNRKNNAQDQDLNKKVQDTVGSGWFSKGYENVSFNVNNGVVTLTGTVDSLDDKRKIEDKVRSLEGVKQVNNQIQVKENQSQQKSASDQEINQKISQTLSWKRSQNDRSDISYEVNNGSVTLHGTVDNAKDKDDIQVRVERIDGVRDVNNKIRVDQTNTGFDTANINAQDYAATAQDQKINADIRDKLNGGWFSKGYDTLILKTNNGIVVITGTVDSPEDVRKISDQIKEVKGVRSVKTQLTTKK